MQYHALAFSSESSWLWLRSTSYGMRCLLYCSISVSAIKSGRKQPRIQDTRACSALRLGDVDVALEYMHKNILMSLRVHSNESPWSLHTILHFRPFNPCTPYLRHDDLYNDGPSLLDTLIDIVLVLGVCLLEHTSELLDLCLESVF